MCAVSIQSRLLCVCLSNVSLFDLRRLFRFVLLTLFDLLLSLLTSRRLLHFLFDFRLRSRFTRLWSNFRSCPPTVFVMFANRVLTNYCVIETFRSRPPAKGELLMVAMLMLAMQMAPRPPCWWLRLREGSLQRRSLCRNILVVFARSCMPGDSLRCTKTMADSTSSIRASARSMLLP